MTTDSTQHEIEASIHSVAVGVCKAEPNIEAAAKKLRKLLQPRRDEIVEELYTSAILRAIHLARGYLMRQVKDSASPNGSRVVAGAADGSASFDRGFLASWQTPDGRWLADVNGNDLVAFAAKESELAAGHAKVATFYKVLAEKVGDRRVGDALTDRQAKALWLGEGKQTKRPRSRNHAASVAMVA